MVGKDIANVRIVMSGAGAAGTAIIRLLLAAGAQHVVVADIEGVVHRGREGLSGELGWLAEHTNALGLTGSLKEAVVGADVFIGVSAPKVLTGDDVAGMAERSIVFALANPEPEVDPAEATKHAAVVATGRSDFPNQIDNVLAFPGVFRGLLDARSAEITPLMLLAAAKALAGVVTDDELNAAYIMPSVFHADVHGAVAAAVGRAAGGPHDSSAVIDEYAPDARVIRRRLGASRQLPGGGPTTGGSACTGEDSPTRSVAGGCRPVGPRGRHVVRHVNVGLQEERGDHRLGATDVHLGGVDRLGDLRGAGA